MNSSSPENRGCWINSLEKDCYTHTLTINKWSDKEEWNIRYEDFNSNDFLDDKFSAETEADVRAKALIYLIENKLVSIEEINQRMGS